MKAEFIMPPVEREVTITMKQSEAQALFEALDKMEMDIALLGLYDAMFDLGFVAD